MDNCCFVLKSTNKKFNICSFSMCGSKVPLFFNEWNREFNLFFRSCYEGRDVGHGKDPLPGQPDLNDMIKTSVQTPVTVQQHLIQAAQVKMVNEREKLLQKKLEAVEEKKKENKVGKTQKTVINALRKEMKLEDLIKQEQEEKFNDETKVLIQKFKHEKRKKKCLENILKKREEQDAKVREQMEIKHEIRKLKQDAAIVVQKKRKNLKKKIEEMRKRIQRRNRLIEQKIQKVRGSMANELMQANRLGDWKVCKKSRTTKQGLYSYCDTNFIDDYAKNAECKDPENFCYICCENEYGNMYLKKRDQCYEMCDHLSKKDTENGEWVWHDDILAHEKSLGGSKAKAKKPKI